jgi:hypothetical protein
MAGCDDVTKTDVTAPSAALLDALRALNPSAPHALAVRGAATLDWLFELDASRTVRRAAETFVMGDSAPRHNGTYESTVLTSASPIPARAHVALKRCTGVNAQKSPGDSKRHGIKQWRSSYSRISNSNSPH